MWTWAIITILAGPVLIIASFMDALTGFGGPGTLPWAEPIALSATAVSVIGGFGAFAIGGRWWTMLLAGSPGILALLARIDDPLAPLVYLLLLCSPVASIIGVGLAAARANGEDEEE